MRKYFDYAPIWDIIFCILIGTGIYFGKPYIGEYINIPTIDNVNKMGVSIIRVSASIIGFLLTITTVIVTFKKGFMDKVINQDKPKIVDDNFSEIPSVTVFDEIIPKEKQFYGTDLHKKVAHVFIYATFEIGLVLFMLLCLQLDIFKFSKFMYSLLTLTAFILLSLSVIRSFYIFQLFLKVHLHEK